MKYIPFTNGTAAMCWQEHNCDHCKRRPCPARTALMACRNLTLRCVLLCGGNITVQKQPRAAFAGLPARCAGFLVVGKKRDCGNNTPLLFTDTGRVIFPKQQVIIKKIY